MVTPVLMRREEVMSIPSAARYARRSEVQIRRWCKQYPISRQTRSNSPIEVSRVALEMILHGDWPALDLYIEGNRQSSEVQRYFEHLGIAE